MKGSDLARGLRSELCVFTDIHEDYLDWCQYIISWDSGHESFFNLPANRHGRSGVVSFTDGRAEIHRWKDSRTFQPVRGVHPQALPVFGSPDWRYVYQLTTKDLGMDPTHSWRGRRFAGYAARRFPAARCARFTCKSAQNDCSRSTNCRPCPASPAPIIKAKHTA